MLLWLFLINFIKEFFESTINLAVFAASISFIDVVDFINKLAIGFSDTFIFVARMSISWELSLLERFLVLHQHGSQVSELNAWEKVFDELDALILVVNDSLLFELRRWNCGLDILWDFFVDWWLIKEEEKFVMGQDQIFDNAAILFPQLDCVIFKICWVVLVNLDLQSFLKTQVAVVFKLNQQKQRHELFFVNVAG